MSEKELKKILTPCFDKDLGKIVQHAKELGALTVTLSRALPPDCAGAIVAANIRENGDLVVISASSAWASRLRYETHTLLEAARAAGLDPSACRIRVTQS